VTRPFDLISFDFDGVLLHNNYLDLFIAACRDLGLRWPEGKEADMLRFVHDYYGGSLSWTDMQEHGMEGRRAAAGRRFLEALAVEGEWEHHIPTLIEQMQAAEIVQFYETGVHDLLVNLRDQGYRLAMLTNRDDEIHDVGAEWELIEPFELIVSTSTLGKYKPDPDNYLHINDYFDVPPHRSLHIGDNPYADVRGAHAAGWSALLIDPDDLFPDWEVPRVHSLHEIPEWLESLNGRNNE
jgi:HAD superfamily hydrolase (TIGR01549 family)